jgi:anti-sigma regulatory factor (Ser/Thr protein kinase)
MTKGTDAHVDSRTTPANRSHPHTRGGGRGHIGYYHETAFYNSDDDFAALVVPFILDAVAEARPTYVALNPANTAIVHGAIGQPEGVTFLPGCEKYARPASTIRELRTILDAERELGSGQVRIVGDVPHPGVGAPWDWWARYEAAANIAYADYDLWGLCPYDLRSTPPEAIDEVLRTHPHIATPDGHHHENGRVEDPLEFLATRPGTWRDPFEAAAPALRLGDPTAAEARHAASTVARGQHLDETVIDDFVLSVSEAVANAHQYGHAPVVVEVWGGDGRALAKVTDRGPGPADPMVGLLPVQRDVVPGRGLWIAHQLCSLVTLARDDAGFSVRLVAGTAHP